MRIEYPIQKIILRFHLDHNKPKKTQFIEENIGATNNARLFMIFIRRKEIKMVAGGNEITEVNII